MPDAILSGKFENPLGIFGIESDDMVWILLTFLAQNCSPMDPTKMWHLTNGRWIPWMLDAGRTNTTDLSPQTCRSSCQRNAWNLQGI